MTEEAPVDHQLPESAIPYEDRVDRIAIGIDAGITDAELHADVETADSVRNLEPLD